VSTTTAIVPASPTVITPPARAEVTTFTTMPWRQAAPYARAGVPSCGNRPFSNRPRLSRDPCSPYFIWFRSGIRNSFNHNLAPADGMEALDSMM
jgi:hypothetical protein